MNVAILAGGFGTRLAEKTDKIPKPMVKIGPYPILWHIMKLYAQYEFNDFFIALGYKGRIIKEYFRNYYEQHSDLTIDLKSGEVEVHDGASEDWTVNLIDTGLETMTGGRVGRLKEQLGNEPFMLTYGDGVSDINLHKLWEFHQQQNTMATITAVRPPARFGGVVFDGNLVGEFTEKPQVGEGWINGGFMVLEPEVFDYIDGDETVFETDVLERLTDENQLSAYQHDDFWQCMDHLRDVRLLRKHWDSGNPPWKIW